MNPSGLSLQQEIQIGAFDQPGVLDTETRHDVVSFLHPHLARLVIFQHHFQFEEVTQPFNPVEMDPGSAHQKQGPLFSHSANLAASQGERFPQLVRLVRWRDVVVALLRTLLIRPAVEDELACLRGERPQFEAARFTAKEGIVLGDVDGALVGDGRGSGDKVIDPGYAGFDLDISWHGSGFSLKTGYPI